MSNYINCLLATVLLISTFGCVTTNYNYYQDASPVPRDSIAVFFGLNLGADRDYSIIRDDNDAVVDIEFDELIGSSPLLSFDVQQGMTDKFAA